MVYDVRSCVTSNVTNACQVISTKVLFMCLTEFFRFEEDRNFFDPINEIVSFNWYLILIGARCSLRRDIGDKLQRSERSLVSYSWLHIYTSSTFVASTTLSWWKWRNLQHVFVIKWTIFLWKEEILHCTPLHIRSIYWNGPFLLNGGSSTTLASTCSTTPLCREDYYYVLYYFCC